MIKNEKEKDLNKVRSNSSSALPSRVDVHGHKYKTKKSSKKKSSGQSNNGKIYRSIPFILLLILFLLPVTYILIINKDKVIESTPINRVGEVISFAKNKENDTNEKSNGSNEPEQKPAPNDNEKAEDENNNTNPDPSERSDEGEEVKENEGEAEDKETEAAEEKVKEEKSEKEDVAYHIVKPGETLYRISVNYYQSQGGVEKIRDANGIAGNEIKVGQKLIIP